MNRLRIFKFEWIEFRCNSLKSVHSQRVTKKSASAHLIIHMAKCSCKAYSHALLLRIGHFDLMARTLTCLCTTNDVSFPFSVSRSRTRVTLAFTLSVSQLWIWLDVKVNETAMDSLRIWTTPMLCGIVDHIQQKSSKYSHLRSRSFEAECEFEIHSFGFFVKRLLLFFIRKSSTQPHQIHCWFWLLIKCQRDNNAFYFVIYSIPIGLLCSTQIMMVFFLFLSLCFAKQFH